MKRGGGGPERWSPEVVERTDKYLQLKVGRDSLVDGTGWDEMGWAYEVRVDLT